MALEFLLPVDKEEGLVLANGAADSTAKLIQIEFLSGSSEEAFGIKIGIPLELEERAVEIVGSGFRR